MTVPMDLAHRCADIAASVTVPELLHRNAITCPDRPALSTFGIDGVVTWRELHDRVAAMALGLSALGLGPGDRMIMMMPSRLEHWVTDLAAVHLGAIPCTAYATLSTDQLRYVAQHSAAKVLVLNGRAELDRWIGVLGDLPELRHVIVVDDEPQQRGTVPLATIAANGATLHAADPDR
ncbi:class I adenylate-forming enzyme family protein [Dactylosporangium salmoneum]|uniref:AMP-dependent synthetase/ligase domain-containing protein n=1 Tax=Dactylosporangium salmoneum TaxID=53361 RepID=A0ABP5TZQ5_9ACTN